jgi:hypothetical protein
VRRSANKAKVCHGHPGSVLHGLEAQATDLAAANTEVVRAVHLVKNHLMRQNPRPKAGAGAIGYGIALALVRDSISAQHQVDRFVREDESMRGIMFLVIGVVGLVAAGILTINFNGSGATVQFNKDKARERAGQLANEVKVIEQSLENNAQAKK